MKGFSEEEANNRGLNTEIRSTFFMPCLNDPSKLQINYRSLDVLNEKLDTTNISEEDKSSLKELFNLNKMSEDEVKGKCCEIRPYMNILFDIWSRSDLLRFSLTSVGIAIGHANIKKLTGEFANLSIWIN